MLRKIFLFLLSGVLLYTPFAFANDPGFVLHPSIKSGGSVSGAICISDDIEFQLGSSCGDYAWLYDETTNNALELLSNDVDGAGADGTLLRIPLGADDICIPVDSAELQFGASCGTDGDITWDGDSLNFGGAAEFASTLQVTGDITAVANIVLGEGDELQMGTGPQYWVNEDTNALHFTSTDCDGGGTDCNWLSVASGTDDVTLTGDLKVTGAIDTDSTACISTDSTALSLGTACATDSTVQFDGTDLKINSSGDVVFDAAIQVGPIVIDDNSGDVTLIDMGITSASGDGTEHCTTIAKDANAVLSACAESDGAGSIDEKSYKLSGFNGTVKKCTRNQETLTFSNEASKTTSGLIPDGATQIAVVGRVLVADTGACTSMDIGDGTDVDLYADNHAMTVGITFDPSDYTAALDYNVTGAEEVTITGVGGNCDALSVRLEAFYCIYTAPTG